MNRLWTLLAVALALAVLRARAAAAGQEGTPPAQEEVPPPAEEPATGAESPPAQEELPPAVEPTEPVAGEPVAGEAGEAKPGEAKPGDTKPGDPEAGEPELGEGEVDTEEPEVPDWRREWEAELAERSSSDFRVADLDNNGWVSLREAEATLDVDREEYQRFDENADGRWTTAEFGERYRAAFARLGSVPAPRVRLREAGDGGPSMGSPLELLRTYDADGDLSLDDTELARLIEALALDLTAPQVRERVDANGSGRLELDELEPVTSLALQRERLDLATPGPALDGDPLRRPLPHDPLGRLDLDDDGVVTRAELERLANGLRLEVRAATVHAALDADGDGTLTRAELLASMQH